MRFRCICAAQNRAAIAKVIGISDDRAGTGCSHRIRYATTWIDIGGQRCIAENTGVVAHVNGVAIRIGAARRRCDVQTDDVGSHRIVAVAGVLQAARPSVAKVPRPSRDIACTGSRLIRKLHVG